MKLRSRKARRRALAIIVFFAFIAPKIASAVHISLSVQEAMPLGVNGLDRTVQPVTVGIPLEAGSGITNTGQLGLTGVSKGQFRELARWPNNNLKWVLVDFQASVPANGTNRSVSLINGVGNFGGPSLAEEKGATIQVDTGVARFVVKKASFNLLDQVTVNDIALVSSRPDGGIFVRDEFNNIFSSANDDSSTAIIEENGPVRAVIRADGALKNSLGERLMDFTVRLHFYTGKSYVRVYMTLRNANLDNVSPVTFNSAGVSLPVSLIGNKSFQFAGKTDSVSGTFNGNETAYLYQAFCRDKFGGDGWRWLNPPMVGDSHDYAQEGYEIRHETTTLHSLSNDGDYSRGWGAIQDSSGNGLTVALRWMSSMWPASIEFDGSGKAAVETYSKYNSKNGLKFAWGAYDTREVMFDFHTNPIDNEQVLYNLQYPLLGRVSLSQYAKSGAFYGETRLITAEQQVPWFNARLEEMIDQGLSNEWINNIRGRIEYCKENIYPAFVRTFYWNKGGGGNQMDLALAALYDYARTGFGGFWLQGEQQSLFKVDVSLLHSDGFDMSQNLVSPDNNGTIQYRVFDNSHSHWISLPILYYMTGNELLRDTVLDFGEWIYGYTKNISKLGGDMRSWGRTLRNFALMYEFTRSINNDKEAQFLNVLTQLTDLVLDSIDAPANRDVLGRNLERGYMWQYHQYGLPGRQISDFFLAQIHYEAVWEALRVLRTTTYSRTEDLEDYLLGLAYFIYDEMYFETRTGIDTKDYGYFYDYNLDQVNNVDGGSQFRPISSARPMLDAYEETGDTKYLDRERKLMLGDIQYVNTRTPSERKSQAFLWTDLRREAPGWHYVNNLVVEDNGEGSYTLVWDVPVGATQYHIKYADKPIVEWLGFDQASRTYKFEPASYTAFFAARNVKDEPTPLSNGGKQSYTIRNLDPTVNWYFAVKYTPPAATTPAAPIGLNILRVD